MGNCSLGFLKNIIESTAGKNTMSEVGQILVVDDAPSTLRLLRKLLAAQGYEVRAANNGISAVVDPLGRIVRELPLGTEGVLDSRLPHAAAPTIYARFGDSISGLMVAMFLLRVTAG